MQLTARKVPYSSIVGQSITLHDANDCVVCQLAILNPIGDGDHKTISGRFADAICSAINSQAVLGSHTTDPGTE